MNIDEKIINPPDISPEEAWAPYTKYKPSMCKEVFELFQKGLNRTQVAAYWGVSTKTVDGWKKAYPDFSTAYEDGLTQTHAYWDGILNEFITGERKGNVTALIFKKCNEDRGNYTQRNEGTTVNINNNTLNMTHQEREQKLANYMKRITDQEVTNDAT